MLPARADVTSIPALLFMLSLHLRLTRIKALRYVGLGVFDIVFGLFLKPTSSWHQMHNFEDNKQR